MTIDAPVRFPIGGDIILHLFLMTFLAIVCHARLGTIRLRVGAGHD